MSMEHIRITEEERERAGLLYENCRQMMFRAARSILKNDADAEDAVSDTFRQLMAKHALPDPKRETSAAFMYVAVRNNALNLLKKRKPVSDVDISEMDASALPSGPKEDSLAEAVSRLPEDMQDLVILRYYIGLSAKEIAALQGVRENTVFVRISKAKARLAALLEEVRNE